MGKTILYIAILGILALGVWFFLFRDNSPFGEKEAGFTVDNVAAIDKIFLADPKGETVSLTKTADGWMVNNKYPSSKWMIKTLLETLHQQYAAYPVPESAHNTVIKSLAGSGVKVELFNKKGETIKVFYVGGQAGVNKGTYMLMKGADRPYVVQIPVYEGYVTPRYSTSVVEWRDRTIVSIPSSHLATVSVQYAAEGEELNSFKMKKNADGEFDIELHPDLKMSAPINEQRVKSYSNFFEKIGAEGYMEGVYNVDSIIASVPKYCDIQVQDDNGNEQDIAIYKMRVNKRSKNVTSDVIPEFDADRMYAIINNKKDTVIIQYETFDKLFRKGYEFYEINQPE